MSTSKGRETRRNDGFRIADARQVRIEALEKTVQRLRRELDTARLDTERAQREVRAMCAANDGLTKQLDREREARGIAEFALIAVRSDLSRVNMMVTRMRNDAAEARAERLTWWDRLFGAKVS
jgi:chromosome segregation ATPase